MRFSSVRIFLCGIAEMILALCAQTSLLAQEKAAATQPSAVFVPFVGCRSDGQVGPREAEAPIGKRVAVPISLRSSRDLAYYRASQGIGVLAPRGWYCFATYGPGGDALFVSPQPIDTANLFSTDRGGLAGPAIEVSYRFGDTSGRYDVAKIIARVFPAYQSFVTSMEKIDPAAGFSFASGPYPRDALTYKSNRVVEYQTPAQTDGLGTHSGIKKNGSPIDGVAMLVGQTPDLLLLSVRLPPELNGLTEVIVRQVERDAERTARH